MQRVTPEIGDAFRPVETALKETFVSEFFEGLGDGVPERGVTRLPVKQEGLALPVPSRRTLRSGRRPVSSQDT